MKGIAGKVLTVLSVMILFTNAATAREFSDLNTDHWAYSEIKTLADEDILWGYPDGTFMPDQSATRAEFATMVIKSLWQEKYDPVQIYYYKDVPQEHWAYEMIQRASELELLRGFPDYTFEPDRNLTKAEAISIVISAVDAGDMTEAEAKKLLQVYKDADKLPAWSIIPAGKAEKYGLIANAPGKNGVFNPEELISRAEIAVTLYNMRKQALLHPSKKLSDLLTPKTADGIVLEEATMESNGIVAIIPAGTIIEGRLVDEVINSQKDSLGKIFMVQTSDNYVTKEKYLLIPAGSNIVGEIVNVKKATYFIRNAKMDLDSKKIIMANHESTGFNGDIQKKCQKASWFSRVYRAIVKGKKIQIKEGDTLQVKLLKPVRINVASTTVL